MPTTPKELVIAGVAQLEKALLRIPESAAKTTLAAELDALLIVARGDVADEPLATLYADLNALAQRITAAMPKR